MARAAVTGVWHTRHLSRAHHADGSWARGNRVRAQQRVTNRAMTGLPADVVLPRREPGV